MAATITDLAHGSGGTSSVSTGATVTAAIASNDWLVVIVGNCTSASSDNVTSVTDTVGNTYTKRVSAFYHPLLGGSCDLFTAPVTVDITSGNITANLSPSAFASGIQVYRYRPGSGDTAAYVGGGSGAGALASSHSLLNVSVTSGDTIFCGLVVQDDVTRTGDSDTTNGSWSALISRADSTGPAASVQTQYKTVTGTGNQNWTVTGTSEYGIPAYVILRSGVLALSIVAGIGSYALTGTTATLRLAHKVAAGAGSYALTGTNATFRIGGRLQVAAGSYSLTGTAATLTHPFKLAAGAGSYALTGTNAATVRGKKVQALTGVYTMGGTNATLTLSGVGAGKLLAAGAGLYALTGNQNLVLVRAITSPGSYLLTGTAASPMINSTASSADGRAVISRTGEGYSEEDAKEARRNKWEAEQFRLKLEAMYDGREYAEQPFPEDVTPAERAAAAAQAAAERAAMFQTMLVAEFDRRQAVIAAQRFAARQAQDEEDAATIAVMGD